MAGSLFFRLSATKRKVLALTSEEVRRKRRWPAAALDTVESPCVTVEKVIPSPYRLSQNRRFCLGTTWSFGTKFLFQAGVERIKEP